MLTTVLGFCYGAGVRVLGNKLARKKAFNKPWEIVGCGVLLGVVGANYNSWEGQMLDAVNEKRVERGMPEITPKKA